MKSATEITTLFLDVGGVLLTNGWDHNSRQLAVKQFKLDPKETESRHEANVDIFEIGKLSLSDYLDRVYFYEKRSFTKSQFRQFMFDQSQPYPEMLKLFTGLKAKYGLKIVVVSNESREINDYRIQKFKLKSFVDFFVSSCYIQLRKPDFDIYRKAIELAQVDLKEVIYIDNLPFLVQMGEAVGLQGICHTDIKTTCDKLATFGLVCKGK